MSNFLENCEKILVLAPHCDDGELGAGGTINKLAKLNKEVTYVAFSTARNSVPDNFPKNILEKEVKEATNMLGIQDENLIIFKYRVRELPKYRQDILEELIKLKSKSNYDLVLMPSLKDIHQDHVTIAKEGLRAFKDTSILSYELLWNNFEFNANCFVSLSNENIQKKCESIKCYKSQGDRNYMNQEFITSMARSRGVQASVNYAEAFEVVRLHL